LKKLALLLLAAASLLGIGGVASAQWYGGGPYYGPGPDYRYRYRERYYDDRYYGRDQRYHAPSRRWGTWNGCAPHYTVQDGLCKPYRGY
jgi:hypothetical protein